MGCCYEVLQSTSKHAVQDSDREILYNITHIHYGGYSSKYSGAQIEDAVGQVMTQHATTGQAVASTGQWFRIAECQDIMSSPQAFMLKLSTLWNSNQPSVCMFACAVSDVTFVCKTLIAMRRSVDMHFSAIRCQQVNSHCYIDVKLTNQNNSIIADIALHNPSYVRVLSPIEAAPAGGSTLAEYNIQYID